MKLTTEKHNLGHARGQGAAFEAFKGTCTSGNGDTASQPASVRFGFLPHLPCVAGGVERGEKSSLKFTTKKHNLGNARCQEAAFEAFKGTCTGGNGDTASQPASVSFGFLPHLPCVAGGCRAL